MNHGPASLARMCKNQTSRRDVLSGIASGGLATVAGCITSGQRKGPRTYVPFTPRPDLHLEWEWFWTTSIDHDIVRANEDGFDRHVEWLFGEWKVWTGFPTEQVHQTVHAGVAQAIVAEFDSGEVRQWMKNAWGPPIEYYNGFEIYESDIFGPFGALSGDTYITIATGGRDAIKHLVDLQAGNVEPLFRYDDDYQPFLDYLPQGAFTQVWPMKDSLGRVGPDVLISAGGQSILFSGEREPAEGRTVITYPVEMEPTAEMIKDYVQRQSGIHNFPITDPEITSPENGVVVVIDTVDPAELFEPIF